MTSVRRLAIQPSGQRVIFAAFRWFEAGAVWTRSVRRGARIESQEPGTWQRRAPVVGEQFRRRRGPSGGRYRIAAGARLARRVLGSGNRLWRRGLGRSVTTDRARSAPTVLPSHRQQEKRNIVAPEIDGQFHWRHVQDVDRIKVCAAVQRVAGGRDVTTIDRVE